jgi:hypothetical protein
MTRILNAIIGIIEAAFVLRIVLQLLGADASSQFVSWLYEVTGRLAGPFLGAFPVFQIGGNSVIDFSIVLAMIGYAILGWLLTLLLSFVFSSVRSI